MHGGLAAAQSPQRAQAPRPATLPPRRSSEWGVMPRGWYFTSALPRALHAACLLAPLGALLDRRARPLFGVALGFVLLYSNLGHKEVGGLLCGWCVWGMGRC